MVVKKNKTTNPSNASNARLFRNKIKKYKKNQEKNKEKNNYYDSDDSTDSNDSNESTTSETYVEMTENKLFNKELLKDTNKNIKIIINNIKELDKISDEQDKEFSPKEKKKKEVIKFIHNENDNFNKVIDISCNETVI